MAFQKYLLTLLIAFIFCALSCKKPKEEASSPNLYAKGFSIKIYPHYKILKVFTPWKDADKTFTYLLVPKENTVPKNIPHDVLVRTPVSKIVCTSTTQISVLESLEKENSLVGFTGTDFISSRKVRKRIAQGHVKELSQNGNVENDSNINTELILSLNPDLVIGSSVNGNNRAYDNISKVNIPVVYDGSWVAESPLARSEWIKFIATFFDSDKKADSIFNRINKSYLETKQLVSKTTNHPTVISGALFRGTWYVPGGKSWAAQLLKDAEADYLWRDSKKNGSLALSFESVLEKGAKADFWIGPNQYISYQGLKDDYDHYTLFKAFQEKTIFTYNKTKGPTGGVLYYESGPLRPDIVLKDLIHILHPSLLPHYKPYFYQALD